MNTRPFSRHNRLHSLWREKGLAFVAIETVEEIGSQMGETQKGGGRDVGGGGRGGRGAL